MTRPASSTTVASVVGAFGSAATSMLATLCCVGPLTYTILGAGGSLAAARLQPWRPWIAAASALFLLLGFWSAYRRRAVTVDGQACSVRGTRAVRITLCAAAALTFAAAIVPLVSR